MACGHSGEGALRDVQCRLQVQRERVLFGDFTLEIVEFTVPHFQNVEFIRFPVIRIIHIQTLSQLTSSLLKTLIITRATNPSPSAAVRKFTINFHISLIFPHPQVSPYLTHTSPFQFTQSFQPQPLSRPITPRRVIIMPIFLSQPLPILHK